MTALQVGSRITSLERGLRPEATNLLRPAACLRHPARPRLGGLVVGHVHHGEPAQELLGLRVGSVGDHDGATGGVGAVDRAFLLQAAGEHVDAGSLHLLHDRHGERSAPAEPLPGVVAHPLLVEVHEVLGHDCSFCSGGPRGPRSPTPRTATAECDTVLPDVDSDPAPANGSTLIVRPEPAYRSTPLPLRTAVASMPSSGSAARPAMTARPCPGLMRLPMRLIGRRK